MEMNRLTGLDALRGVAAVVVLVYHATRHFYGDSYPQAGGLAVDFFFMLSGYVMARTYEARLGETLSAARFLAMRWKRLWGTVAVGTLIGFVFLISSSQPADRPLLALTLGLLFLPSLDRLSLYPLNGPAWSIFFELFANAVHALSLRRLSNATLIIIAAISLATTLWLSRFNGEFPGGVRDWSFGICFFRVLAPYVIGIVLFRVVRDRPVLPVSPLALYLMLPLVLAAGSGLNQLLFGALFVAALCPLIMLAGISTANRFGPSLGAFSFPLYAIHDPVLQLVKVSGGGMAIGLIMATLAALIVAFFKPAIATTRRLAWSR